MEREPEINLKKYLPHIKQQMLREMVTNKTYGLKEWLQFLQLLDVNGLHSTIRLILVYPLESTEHELMFALANIADDLLAQEGVLAISAIIDQSLVILADDCSTECVRQTIEQIGYYYERYYRRTFIAAISDVENITHIKRLYIEGLHAIQEGLGRLNGKPGQLCERYEGYQLITRRNGQHAPEMTSQRTTPADIVAEMTRYVHDHLSDPCLSLTKLSKEVLYMNGDYLGKLFRKYTGVKFSQYVMNLRVMEAIHYMDTDEEMKIIDIATKVGYPHNVQYFSQVFKRIVGCPPTEYRRKAAVKQ